MSVYLRPGNLPLENLKLIADHSAIETQGVALRKQDLKEIDEKLNITKITIVACTALAGISLMFGYSPLAFVFTASAIIALGVGYKFYKDRARTEGLFTENTVKQAKVFQEMIKYINTAKQNIDENYNPSKSIPGALFAIAGVGFMNVDGYINTCDKISNNEKLKEYPHVQDLLTAVAEQEKLILSKLSPLVGNKS